MPKPEILTTSSRNLAFEDVEISTKDRLTLLKTIASEKGKKKSEKSGGG